MNLYGSILLYLVSSVCFGNNTHFRKTDDFYDPVAVKTFNKYHNILLKRWYTRNKPLDIVGRNFKVIVEEVPPYIITSKSENGTLSINGYIGDIWNILQEELKFTSTFYILNITEGKAALQNGTYDIMLNPTTLSSQDIYNIDHSMPIMSSWYKLFMRLKEGQGSSSSYILAWSRDLWLAFVGTVIVITIFMWGISSFRRFCEIEKCDSSNGLVHKLPLRDERTNQLSFSCCLLFVLGSVTQRGFGLRESPTATSLHVVAVLSLLFGLLMQTSYSAALVSRLAVLKTDQGVEKLSDISARKSHSLCIRVENFAYSALFLGKDGELAPEWKRIVNAPPCVPAPITDQDIRETICSKEAITLDSTTVMSRIMQDPLPCFITKLKNRYAVFYVPLLMRKGFPYKNLFNACLLRLHTSGLIQRLLKVWVHQTLDLPVPLNELGVTMDHVNKILWLYAVAIIISVMLLSLEIVHYNIHLEEDEDEDEQ